MRAFALTFLLAVVGCIPIRVSSECRTQMSECERNCSPAIPPSSMDTVPPDTDTRSACQKSCESLCNN